MAAPTFFGVSTNPADNATLIEPQTAATITPPASMLTGDLVILRLYNMSGTAGEAAIVNTGGQTWTSDTTDGSYSFAGSAAAHRIYWARFNGTWTGGNPTWSAPAKSGSQAVGAQMLVFRPDVTTNLWGLDTAPSWAGFAAATLQTIPGLTPVNSDTVTLASWCSDDDNTWGTLTGTGWDKTGLGAQYRNLGGNDIATTYAYNLKAAPSATNDVSQTQLTLGGDAGSYFIVSFYSYNPNAVAATPTVTTTITAALTTDPLSAELVDTTTGTDTVTLASWVETGDVALIMAFRDGSATPPDVPSFVVDSAASTLPTGNWNASAFGNGTFVAVANASTAAASSSDGITWTARTMPSSISWTSVTFGNGTFVAVASGSTAAASSSDGITWTARTLPVGTTWKSVAYGAGVFTALGLTSCAYSADGVTWTAGTALPVSGTWQKAVYGNGVFVAVDAQLATDVALSSTDGITWTRRTLPSTSEWFGVAYGDGVFVAVSATSGVKAASSTDGITWTARNLPTSGAWYSVGYGDGVFLAVRGSSTSAAISLDGVTWTTTTLFASRTYWDVAFGNGVFFLVAYNNSGAVHATYTPGPTTLDSSGSGTSSSVLAYKVLTAGGVQSIGPFTNATSVACNVYRTVDPTTPVGDWAISTGTGTTVTLPALTTAPDSFAVGFAGHESTDVAWPSGVEFAAVARTMPTSSNWQSVTYGNGTFVAVATSSTAAASSADGITWTARTLPSSSSWLSVTYGNGTFVSVANNSTTAASSSDGITWTARALPSNSFWQSVTFGNGLFVAVAFGTTAAASSADGITWTARALPTSSEWRSVTYGNGTFVAIVSGPSTAAATSSDGITWTARTLPTSSNWYSVTYGNGTFVAVANNSTAAASSADGITWTARTMPTSRSWRSITYGSMFVAVAYNTTSAASSSDGITWAARTMPTSSAWISIAYGNGTFVAVTEGTTAAATIQASSPLAAPLVHRAQSIDATDAIVVYDTAGPAS